MSDGKTHFRFFWASGTGNSRRAAVWAAEEAGCRGNVVTLMDMGDRVRDAWAPDAFVGLFFPVHGFTAPWSVLRFVLRLPRGEGTPAFVVVTRGGGWYLVAPLPGFAGNAPWLVGLLLFLKGYRLRGLTGLDMPSNWFSLHPAMTERHAEFWKRRSERRMRRFLGRLAEGKRWFLSLGNVVEFCLGLPLLPLSALYTLVGRFYLAKLFFADRRCNGCGVCARHCPEKAIVMKGDRPYWTFKCESCMRCVAFCPERAVEASHTLALCFAWGTVLLFGSWGPQEWANGSIGMILRGASGIAFAWVGYGLFHRLIRWRPALVVATYATLTTWYRRYRESGTRLRDLAQRQPD